MGSRGRADPRAPLRVVPELEIRRASSAGSAGPGATRTTSSSGMSRYVPVAETTVGVPATIAIESDPLTSPRCGNRRSTAISAATSQALKSSSETS